MPLLGILYALLWVAVVAVALGIAVWGFIFWDRRYRGASGPADQFQATAEAFRDPTTGRMMRVYFNPATGERQYREAPPS